MLAECMMIAVLAGCGGRGAPAPVPAATLAALHEWHVLHLEHVARLEALAAGPSLPAAAVQAPQGTYSCTSLESLWISAGGNPASAVTAASIAMAESGGDPGAISPTGDYGLWQVNAASWGAMATLDPYGNALAAVRISGNGSDWSPWVTWQTGAWSGQCGP